MDPAVVSEIILVLVEGCWLLEHQSGIDVSVWMVNWGGQGDVIEVCVKEGKQSPFISYTDGFSMVTPQACET